MKLTQPVIGNVFEVGGIKPNKKGFSQMVILHQPPGRDGFNRVVQKEQHYRIHIFSTQQTDKRFLSPSDRAKLMKANCYLDGEQWITNTNVNYDLKLKLDSWQS